MVPVTINSDDPPMFSTTLNREYEVAAGLLGLDARVSPSRPARWSATRSWTVPAKPRS
jgi:adenosine deaminase